MYRSDFLLLYLSGFELPAGRIGPVGRQDFRQKWYLTYTRIFTYLSQVVVYELGRVL